MIESKIESSAPYVIDFRVAQLRVDIDHAQAQNLGTAADGLIGFRKECGASTEEHATIGREPVVVEIIFRVVDHPVARAQFASERFSQKLPSR